MSGRLYDELGCEFYICTKCNSKKDTINSTERNFNGPYCKKCKSTELISNNDWNNYVFTIEEKQEINNTLFKDKPLNYYNNNGFVIIESEYNKAVLEAKRKILIRNENNR